MVDAGFRPFDSMRIALTLAAFVMIAPAAAQSVTVNSTGVTGDGRVLIDPGTGQSRILPPLLEPWQFGTVTLRRPLKLKRTKPAETTDYASAPLPEAPPKTLPKAKVAKQPRTAVASSAPPPRRTPSMTPAPAPASTGLGDFGNLDTLTVAPKPVETPKPAPQKPVVAKPVVPKPVTTKPVVAEPVVAKPQPTPVIVVAKPPPPPPPVVAAKPVPETKPVQKASLEPTKPRTGKARDTVVFAPNASDPSGPAVSAVRALATALGPTLGDGSSRIQLMAYGGQRGEKSSDTRRLSLKRALVVRQLLIDDGIPAERIDVFALGGADDSGPLDRVDVLVKG